MANEISVMRSNLLQMGPQFEAALPKHISVEKFTRVALTAIQSNPDLMNADRTSLFGAIVRLAQDGLLPDGRDAAIVLFGNKAQAMPMIVGVLRKIRQSGEVSYVSAQVVYENDDFNWTLGFDETVTHQPPKLDQPRGKAIGAYATSVLKDGSRLLEVMSLEEIEKVRNVSRAKNNGPWVTWWGEMARKTVIRRLSKRLPMSTDLEGYFDRDETVSQVEAVAALAVRPQSRLDALESMVDEPHDPETGEVETVEAVEEPVKASDAPRRTRADVVADDLAKRLGEGLNDELHDEALAAIDKMNDGKHSEQRNRVNDALTAAIATRTEAAAGE